MSHIWLSDKPHMRRLELFQERNAILQRSLYGLPIRTSLWHVINSGLLELPDKDRRTVEHERFLILAIAVAHRQGMDSIIGKCWFEWKGSPLRKPMRITSNPDIRKALGYSTTPYSVWRDWVRHDWQRFTCWLWHVATMLNR